MAPLQLPPLAEQAVSFRLIGGLEDSRFLLADNVYMRRGCVALALVRIVGLIGICALGAALCAGTVAIGIMMFASSMGG